MPDVDFTLAFADGCPSAYGVTSALLPPYGSLAEGEGGSGDDWETPAAPPISHQNRWDCKMVVSPTYDFLLPEAAFLPGHASRFDSYGTAPPWDLRRPVLLFRGSAHSWDGSRIQAMRLGLLRPDLLDIKAVASAATSPAAVALQTAVTRAAAAAECLEAYGNASSAKRTAPLSPALGSLSADCAAIAADTPMPPRDQLGYRYALDMDGLGPTDTLKNLFLGGFLVFKTDSPVKKASFAIVFR